MSNFTTTTRESVMQEIRLLNSKLKTFFEKREEAERDLDEVAIEFWMKTERELSKELNTAWGLLNAIDNFIKINGIEKL